ncbi:MAG: hypothetical protein WC718_00040 [Phycisphaerales bacterium]
MSQTDNIFCRLMRRSMRYPAPTILPRLLFGMGKDPLPDMPVQSEFITPAMVHDAFQVLEKAGLAVIRKPEPPPFNPDIPKTMGILRRAREEAAPEPPRFTTAEIRAYIEGWGGGPYTPSYLALLDAWQHLDDPQDGIAAARERGAL